MRCDFIVKQFFRFSTHNRFSLDIPYINSGCFITLHEQSLQLGYSLGLLSQPRVGVALSSRGFRRAGPSLWDSLPRRLRSADSYTLSSSPVWQLTFSLVQASLTPSNSSPEYQVVLTRFFSFFVFLHIHIQYNFLNISIQF